MNTREIDIKKHTNIGIIGIGAIGSVIVKSLLAREGNLLKYFSRSPKIEIKVLYDSNLITYPIKCEKAPCINEELDWVIICLKAHQIQSASALLQSLIKPNTKVAVIRNGINLVKDILPFTSSENILPCMIDCPVQPIENNIYWQLKHPMITLPKSGLADQFNHLFLPSQMTINQTNDFKTENWKKLIESSALGAILCLTGQTCHIFQDTKILDIYKLLVQEGISVAKADGAQIKENFKDTLTTKLIKYPTDKGSSMLTDRKNGNKIEVSAKNGAISKIAKHHRIATPMNDLMSVLLEKVNLI